MDPRWIRSRQDVFENLHIGTQQVLDVRSAGRFAGTEPEPREGLRSGHIPGSLNLPWTELVDPVTGCMKSREELEARYEQAGIDFEKPVICACGSGITACVGAFGLYLLNHPQLAVYDRSWAEWGRHIECPVETAS